MSLQVHAERYFKSAPHYTEKLLNKRVPDDEVKMGTSSGMLSQRSG